IVDPIRVDVTCRAHGGARRITGADAGEDEAAAAVAAAAGIEARKRDDCRKALRRTEHDETLTCARIPTRIGIMGAYDEIVDPVPVDVARRAHGFAREVTSVDAGEHEAAAAVAAAAGIEARKRDDRRKTLRRTEHDVGLTCEVISAGVRRWSADDEIVDAVRV